MPVLSDTNKMSKFLSKPITKADYTSLPADVEAKIRKRAAGYTRFGAGKSNDTPMTRYGQSTGTLIYEPYLNPLIDKQHLEFPADRERQNQRYWDYFLHDPLLSMGIRLLVEFPLSNFKLVHEDAELEDFFNEMAENLDLLNLCLNMGIHYHVLGEAIPFGFVDDPKNPKMWKDFILLNPDWALINRDNTARPRGEGSFGKYSISYAFYKDPNLRKIVEDGPKSKTTSDLYRQIPKDILNSVQGRTYIKLPDTQCGYFQRVGNYFTGRGESIIRSCTLAMMYRDKIREGQYTIIDRHISPTEFYMIGEQGQPATAPELAAFDDAMQGIWNGTNKALIWHHALRIQWEGASGRILPLQPEYQYVENQVLTALGINKTFIHGEGPVYANASVAMEMLISRFLTFRQQLENILLKQVFAPVCAWNNLYKDSSGNRPGSKYKFIKKKRVLNLPEIKWDKENLREDREKINMIAGFAQNGILPFDMLWKALNLDPKKMREMLKEQLKEMPGVANILKVVEIPGLPGELPVSPTATPIGTPIVGVGGDILSPTPGLDIIGGGEEEGPLGNGVVPPESYAKPALPVTI